MVAQTSREDSDLFLTMSEVLAEVGLRCHFPLFNSLLILEFLVTCSFVRSDTVLSGDRDILIYSQPASPTLTMYHVRMLAQYAMLVSVARHYSSVCCREWKEVSKAL